MPMSSRRSRIQVPHLPVYRNVYSDRASIGALAAGMRGGVCQNRRIFTLYSQKIGYRPEVVTDKAVPSIDSRLAFVCFASLLCETVLDTYNS